MTETIAEIADREALEAENESENDNDEPDPEPSGAAGAPGEPEPEPAVASSQTTVEERDKKLKSEDTRHENALKKIWGDEFAEKAYCPCCLGQGFLSPWPAGAMPDAVWEAVTSLSGRLDAQALNIPDEFQVCGRCNGWGQVGTPSRSEHHAAVPCKHCDSRGYFDLSDAMQAAKLRGPEPAVAAPPPVRFDAWPTPTPAEPVQTIKPPDGWKESGSPGADTFGRWPGHPRYGIDPSLGGGW